VFKNILVPLDGSPLAEKVLPFVEEVAKMSGAQVELLTVVITYTFPGIDPTDAQVEVVQGAEKYLESMAEKLKSAGLEVSTHVRYGHDAEEILAHTAKRDIDLVIMASHGHSGYGRWNLGGVTKRVVSHCTKPLLTIKVNQ
jgi:nucleotide-binding universal stress UspA family protein